MGKAGGIQGMRPEVATAVATAGELMIRAAATLGTLTREEQERLSEATDGKLTHCLAWAVEGAAGLSHEVAESMKRHPPSGFVWLDGKSGERA